MVSEEGCTEADTGGKDDDADQLTASSALRELKKLYPQPDTPACGEV